MFKIIFCCSLHLLFSLRASAAVFSLNTELSKSSTSSSLGFDYSAETVSDRALQWAGGSLSLGADNVKTEASASQTSGSTETLRTRNSSGSLRFQSFDFLKATLSGQSSQTPETDFKESGGQAKFEVLFSDKYSLGVLFGRSNISQKYTVTVLNRSVQRELTLEKNLSGVELSAGIQDWGRIVVGGNFYQYSKSKSDLQTAYQSQFLNNYLSSVVSSISGLPDWSTSLDFTYYWKEDIDLNFYFQNSHLIVDDSQSQRIEILVTKYWTEYNLGLGAAQNRSKSEQTAALLLNLAYSF